MKLNKKSLGLTAGLVLTGVVLSVNADGMKASMDIHFPTDTKRQVTKSVTIPDLVGVDSVTVDNGTASFTRSGNTVKVTVNGGVADKRQTGGEYIPSATKWVTGQPSKNYNKDKYVGTLDSYVIGGEYIPDIYRYETDYRTITAGYHTPSFPSSISYNDGEYHGSLTQSGSPSSVFLSGSYTPSDSRYVTGQTSSYYSSGGYYGSLNSYLAGGSYTPSDSRTESSTASGSITCSWTHNGSGWYADGGASYNLPSSIHYNSGGYSGTLSRYNVTHTNCGTNRPTSPGKRGDHISYQNSATGYYSGTVTKPAVDTRYYRYEGYVTKPAVDTRQYEYTQYYSGQVVKPGIDTRIYEYEGYVTKPAEDTRTWEDIFTYNVKLNYRLAWKKVGASSSTLNANGLKFDPSKGQRASVINAEVRNSTNPITSEFWMKWNGNSESSPLVVKRKSGQYNVGFTKIDNTCIAFGVKARGGTLNGFCVDEPSWKNNWVHIATVLPEDTSDVANSKIYVNGELQEPYHFVEDGNDKPLYEYPAITTDVELGNNFNGELTEVRLWGEEKSKGEINGQMGMSLMAPEESLLGYWRPSPLTTKTIYDHSRVKSDADVVGYSTAMALSNSNVSDYGATLMWNSVPLATAYDLKRGSDIISSELITSYEDNELLSESSYTFTVLPRNDDGEGVSTSTSLSTKVGSLDILSAPPTLKFSPLSLNGDIQTSSSKISNSFIIKDTRKVRDGWRLQAKASPIKSSKLTLNKGKVKVHLKKYTVQTNGNRLALPEVTTEDGYVTIDSTGDFVDLVVADPKATGAGIYEVIFEDDAVNLIFNPEKAYVGSYSTSVNWRLVPGDK